MSEVVGKPPRRRAARLAETPRAGATQHPPDQRPQNQEPDQSCPSGGEAAQAGAADYVGAGETRSAFARPPSRNTAALPLFTAEEIARHVPSSGDDAAAGERSAWIVVHNHVLDVARFLRKHPGGQDTIQRYLGKDATMAFEAVHPSASRASVRLLEASLRVGTVDDAFGTEALRVTRPGGHLVDLHRPVLRQIARLGPYYSRFVHEPVPFRLRLFDSDVLEAFTKTPWWAVPLLFVPLTLLLMATALWHGGLWPPLLIPLTALGGTAWTLTEYSVHRFVFHNEPPPDAGAVRLLVHFLFHGIHHLSPNDPLRLVMPPVVSLSVAAILLPLFYSTLGPAYGFAVAAGYAIGYTLYDCTHYWLHHTALRSRLMRRLRQNHLEHHYGDPALRFGITNLIWDGVFGTSGRVR